MNLMKHGYDKNKRYAFLFEHSTGVKTYIIHLRKKTVKSNVPQFMK